VLRGGKEMSANEILIAIRQLPIEEQEEVLKKLSQSIAESTKEDTNREAEVERLLLAKGLLTKIPSGFDDEGDDFEPIEVVGKPVSETIIEERR
jgi:hypothetical protein